jgi:hypothetical protein
MTDIELTKRLEKLERDNRRLKRFGLAALVIVAVIGTIAATQPVPQKITAHEFDVVDNSGEVRAEVGMFLGAPDIRLDDAQGFSMVLGNAQTVTPATGATEQTSTASIIMFGNDKEHHVIWRAP